MSQFSRRIFGAVVAVFLASVAVSACTDFSSPPPSLGHATISVVDSATNAGVPNIEATLYLNDRTTAWASLRTTANGTGEFRPGDGGVIPQTYIVRLVLTGTVYTFAAGEANDKPLQVIIGSTTNVVFKLHKTVAGGLPGT
ncbi:MAG: hypothetical protein ABIQ55_04765 [Gemmatimonadaceae bacterium]